MNVSSTGRDGRESRGEEMKRWEERVVRQLNTCMRMVSHIVDLGRVGRTWLSELDDISTRHTSDYPIQMRDIVVEYLDKAC